MFPGVPWGVRDDARKGKRRRRDGRVEALCSPDLVAPRPPLPLLISPTRCASLFSHNPSPPLPFPLASTLLHSPLTPTPPNPPHPSPESRDFCTFPPRLSHAPVIASWSSKVLPPLGTSRGPVSASLGENRNPKNQQ